MLFVIPRYGILGAAYVAAGFAVLNRAIVTPYLLCRLMDFSLARYLADIYVKPLLAGIPVLVYAMYIKSHWIPGTNWFQLIACIALIAIPYYILCGFVAVEPDHRAVLREWIAAHLGRLRIPG
jgi:hypothetical protein